MSENETPLLVQGEEETPLALRKLDPAIIQQIVLNGDLAGLSPEQRIEYYTFMCDRCGLDAATRPLEFIKLQGKLVLYMNKTGAAQLRTIHGVSVVEMRDDIVGGHIYRVFAKVQNARGKTDVASGALTIRYPQRQYNYRAKKWEPHPKAGQTLEDDDLANAMMKAETKAKRRATLSICGLGMLDESELETIPQAARNGEQPADLPKQSALSKLLGDKTGPAKPLQGPPETPANGDARHAFTTAAQELADRDCKRWKLEDSHVKDIYMECARLSGLKSNAEIIPWMEANITLGLVEDGGEVKGVTVKVKEEQPAQ